MYFTDDKIAFPKSLPVFRGKCVKKERFSECWKIELRQGLPSS